MDNPKCQFCGNKHRMGPEFCPALTGDTPQDEYLEGIQKRDPVTEKRPKPRDPVTKPVETVTKDLTPRDPITGIHCATCTCIEQRLYDTKADKQRAYRGRKGQK